MNLTPQELKEYSKEHLACEIQMLSNAYYCYINLHISSELRQLFSNFLIESFVIHLRNIISFLYPTKNIHKNDICAKYFFEDQTEWEKICPKISKILVVARERAHREVGHLTIKRITGITTEKEWHFKNLMLELIPILVLFSKSADKDKLDESITFLVNNIARRNT